MSRPHVSTVLWQSYADRLAEQLTTAGDLTNPRCRDAVRTVARHEFLPPPLDASTGRRRWPVPGDHAGTASWLAAAYEPGYVRACVPADGEPHPVQADGPAFAVRALHALRIGEGMRVLEVGCGAEAAGYRTALLAQWLGSRGVHTVDDDPLRLARARVALDGMGLSPTLARAAPAVGLPDHAPFDRIIATGPLDAVPIEWLHQTRPGGLVLVHLRGGLGAGGYALLRRSNATLHGRFLSWPDPPGAAPSPVPVRLVGGTRQRSTPVDPARLATHRAFALLAQLRLPPGTCRGVRLDATGNLATYLTAPDGSWAEIAHRVGPHGVHEVRTSAADLLTPALCAAWTESARLGHPLISQFGVTVTVGGTRVWHRDPVHGPRWSLVG